MKRPRPPAMDEYRNVRQKRLGDLAQRCERLSVDAASQPVASMAVNHVPTKTLRFALLALPTELRLEIYRHILIKPRPVNMNNYRPIGNGYVGGARALLLVSHQVRRECLEVFYGETTFQTPTNSAFTTAFLRAMMPQKRTLLKHVRAFGNHYVRCDAHEVVKAHLDAWYREFGIHAEVFELPAFAIVIEFERAKDVRVWQPATRVGDCSLKTVKLRRISTIAEKRTVLGVVEPLQWRSDGVPRDELSFDFGMRLRMY